MTLASGSLQANGMRTCYYSVAFMSTHNTIKRADVVPGNPKKVSNGSRARKIMRAAHRSRLNKSNANKVRDIFPIIYGDILDLHNKKNGKTRVSFRLHVFFIKGRTHATNSGIFV